MSIIVRSEDQSKEYFLDQISSIKSSTSNDSGLYLSDGKIVDANGNDVTAELDAVLSSSVVEGDMIIEYTE